jgi:hypothetical protein
MSTHPDSNPAATVVDEAKAFCQRHPGLNGVQKSFGGLAMGLMKALYECPECGPGFYRLPMKHPENAIGCRNCRNVWTRQEPTEKPAKKKRSSKK